MGQAALSRHLGLPNSSAAARPTEATQAMCCRMGAHACEGGTRPTMEAAGRGQVSALLRGNTKGALKGGPTSSHPIHGRPTLVYDVPQKWQMPVGVRVSATVACSAEHTPK